MKTEHKIYAGLAVLAILGGGYYVTNSSAKAEREQRTVSSAKAELPAISIAAEDVEKITRVEIKNADKPKIVLEKKGDLWELVEPIAAKVNQTDARSLIDNFKELKIKESIDPGDKNYAQYDLEDQKAVHVVAMRGGDKALDLYFGKSGTRGQMARVGGKPGVFTVDKYQAFLYTKEAKNWREKSILKLSDDDAKKVSAVELKNANGVFKFTKDGEAWKASREKVDKEGKLEKVEKWEKFDSAKVEDLVRAFKSLAAIDFAEADVKPEDTGIDAAEKEGGVLKIKLGDTEHVLRIGKVQKGKNRYAIKEGGDGTVFVISSWSADWGAADAAKFEKKDEKKDGKDGPPPGEGDMPDMDMPEMPPGMGMDPHGGH